MTYQWFTYLRGLTSQDIDHTGRKPYLLHNLSKLQGGQWCVTSGFQDNSIAHGESGCDLPRQHKQRKVPGDNLPYHTNRNIASEFRLHELRPASIIIEVPSYQWSINIARLTNRLAIVQ